MTSKVSLPVVYPSPFINTSPTSTTDDNVPLLLSAIMSSIKGTGDSTNVSSSCARTPVLPPCRICGEKASGFHYGVNTCEACKAFYRRSLHRKEVYMCIGDGNCEVMTGKRNSCAACRLKRCVALGMSKKAIKTGRYTNEKKTEDIKEVKRLQLQRQGDSMDRMSEAELLNVIEHITEVLEQQLPYHELSEVIQERERIFLEQEAFQRQMFGPMQPISRQEYMSIYASTGVDVDGRRQLVKELFNVIEKSVVRFITFAKSIPYFKELALEDQIALIKASRFEVWMLVGHPNFNPQHKLLTLRCGMVLSLDELTKLHDREYLESLFMAQARIKRLGLKNDEVCILAALSVMFTDRCALVDTQKVEKSQSLLLECLLYLLKKNHPHEPLMLAKVVNVMIDLRTVRENHLKDEEMFTSEWRDKIDFPPLIYEMWSS